MVATTMKLAIVIPARYGSTRFPGKPLAKIAGKTMLSRVVDVAREAVGTDADVIVTTEDQRIADHAKELKVECVITSPDCPTGSDRVLEAIEETGRAYDFVINLQGDTPFTPVEVLRRLIEEIKKNDKKIEVATPVHQLTWEELDTLREAKKTTPFSGTTVVRNQNGRALWFSKSIIPALRKEDRITAKSPVFQHIGIYGYSVKTLQKFVALPQSFYEQLEGLEQLRFLENGISIQTVEISAAPGLIQSGIDSPEDLKRAEALLAKTEAA
jgi:3-deoxy-manno-octulosonate cytidylyltransferase (CMP-KDO synthetase)